MMHKAAPSSTSILWLMLGLTCAASPHFLYQPIWVSLVFLIAISWRCMNIWFDWYLPTNKHYLVRFFQLFIAIASISAITFTYGSTIGRDAGVAFLVMMLGLKVTEIRTHRDYYVTVFLGYFVVITNFFFTQSIPMVLMMFLVVIIMTACLITVNDPKHIINKKSVAKLSGQMILQSIPIMLILFVLFPRIAGPLWGLPQDSHSSITGMDDKMTLGKISQLIQSDEVAFRVEFEAELPPPEKRYWRGPVLWVTDGTTWTEISRDIQISINPDINFSGAEYNYKLTLEPHNDHWLFALDMPNKSPKKVKAHFSSDGQLRSNDAIKQRVQYQLSSQTDFQFNNDEDPFINVALDLPELAHPKTKQLAQQWRSEERNDQAYIQRVMNHFNQQGFYYTLSPPLLQGDTVDNFLFDSRRGFCEHYAASFTVLMRAAGIPARVVTGYQGGEINPVNDILVVRQRDAHAWAEVWLQDRGWVRIDPTAAISPARIERGINEIMPIGMRSPLFVANSDTLLELWQTINNNWDAANNMWNLWVLAYGPEKQREFLSKLGMKNPDWQAMAMWLLSLVILVFIFLPLFLFYQRKHRDPISAIYQQFCSKLLPFNLHKENSEGPADFCKRAITQLPHEQQAIDNITQLYINLVYSQHPAKLDDFAYAVKNFAPKQAAYDGK
jgi:transglutaminase-like putative cysteine protease